MTQREAIHRAYLKLGHSEKEIKERFQFADQFQAGMLDSHKQLQLREGVTEEQYVDGLVATLKYLDTVPRNVLDEALKQGLKGQHARQRQN